MANLWRKQRDKLIEKDIHTTSYPLKYINIDKNSTRPCTKPTTYLTGIGFGEVNKEVTADHKKRTAGETNERERTNVVKRAFPPHHELLLIKDKQVLHLSSLVCTTVARCRAPVEGF